MEGLVIKPEGFDPPGSTLPSPISTNATPTNCTSTGRPGTPVYHQLPYYASRGYVIFIPTSTTRWVIPGESALEAVTTGLSALLDKGFIDRERIGVQSIAGAATSSTSSPAPTCSVAPRPARRWSI